MTGKEHHHAGHIHFHSPGIGDSYNRAFLFGIILNLAFVITEVIAGLIYHSIALLTDAGHNAADVAGLLLSFLAFRFARRKTTPAFTYGYKKTTVLAAFANAVFLLVAIGVLGYESFGRLRNPVAVRGDVIAWVAASGILVNAVSAWLFFKNRKKDLNIKAAYLHLMADALVSVGVVVSGLVILYTKWYWLDPVVGLIIMVVILVGTWSLLRDSFKMAVDAVPAGIDIHEIREEVLKMKDVLDMDHIHVWPLSTTENALTAHVILNNELTFEERIEVVRHIKHELEHLNIHHSTIEMDGTGKSINC